jgi:hypothetical protein
MQKQSVQLAYGHVAANAIQVFLKKLDIQLPQSIPLTQLRKSRKCVGNAGGS